MQKKVSTTKKKKPSTPKVEGCRRCKYRVCPPKGQNGEKVPSCCFGYEINDKEIPTICKEGLFVESNWYYLHPEEP